MARGLARRRAAPRSRGLGVMFLGAAVIVLLASAIGLALPREGIASLRAARGEWRVLLRRGPMRRMLLFAFSAYLFVTGPMGLLPVYVRAHGGTLETVQNMWILMLVVEIPLILCTGMGLKRIGARGLLAAGVLAGGVRWTVCGLTANPYWIYPVQMLHGVMVTGLMMGGPLYVDRVAPGRLRSTAQGLVAMVGLGSAASPPTPRPAAPRQRHANAPYLIGGAGALVVGLAICRILPPVAHEDEQPQEAAGAG